MNINNQQSQAPKKIIVYTCVTNGYDQIYSPSPANPNIEYICFNDGTISVPPPWRDSRLPNKYCGAKANRHTKICYYEYDVLREADILIYIDGSVRIVGDLEDLVSYVDKSDGHTFLYEHPYRNCIYEEINECAISKKAPLNDLAKLNKKLKNERMPIKFGLFEGGIIVRKPAADGQQLMSAWWSEYCSGVKRDQLALMYVSWKTNLKISSLGEPDHRRSRRFFQCGDGHKGDWVRRHLIWWLWRPIVKKLMNVGIIDL